MNPIEQAELTRLKKELTKLKLIRSCAKALVENVKQRHPGEDLKCPFMKALDDSIKNSE